MAAATPCLYSARLMITTTEDVVYCLVTLVVTQVTHWGSRSLVYPELYVVGLNSKGHPLSTFTPIFVVWVGPKQLSQKSQIL